MQTAQTGQPDVRDGDGERSTAAAAAPVVSLPAVPASWSTGHLHVVTPHARRARPGSLMALAEQAVHASGHDLRLFGPLSGDILDLLYGDLCAALRAAVDSSSWHEATQLLESPECCAA